MLCIDPCHLLSYISTAVGRKSPYQTLRHPVSKINQAKKLNRAKGFISIGF